MAQAHLPIEVYNFKAGVNYAYARACRERCQPAECSLHLDCWVAHGTAESLDQGKRSPRCLACDGKLVLRNRFLP
jgi:hypothetical protein